MTAGTGVPRPEYPRPRLVRDRWANLNGEWAFAFDDDDAGLAAGWDQVTAEQLVSGEQPFDQRIVVPFSYQSEASGLGQTDMHPVLWYARTFSGIDLGQASERVVLHIGAADRDAWVWVNGQQVARHEGGYTPFSADVTDVLTGDDVIVVRVVDPTDELDSPRGKQFWRERGDDVFYSGVGGIWQTVWLEPRDPRAIEDVVALPLLDDAAVELTVRVPAAAIGCTLSVQISVQGRTVARDTMWLSGSEVRRRWDLTEGVDHADAAVIVHRGVATWSPEQPRLYDVELAVRDPDGAEVDRVCSYFGMRKIEARDGQVFLNDRPLYQRLVLDQGYFAKGGYTATSDEDLRRDIELAKAMGFNGARKHQKIEDPRWLYWADRLGFLVWEEMPSGFRFSDRYVRRATSQWQDAITRDRSHPCIIVWTPVNESWGAPGVRGAADAQQVAFLDAMYHLTKAIDPTRLVVSNDGWEHATTDLCTVHDYADQDGLRAHLADRDTVATSWPMHRRIHLADHPHAGQPILVSEFGGIALAPSQGAGVAQVVTPGLAPAGQPWGFHTVADPEALLQRFAAFLAAVIESPPVVGFCWTQLTDVQQEVNGLLTADRTPKIEPDAVRDVVLRARARRTWVR